MIYSVPLLIIDDLGTESATAAKFTELINILDTRSRNTGRCPRRTLISTNLSPKDLYRFYDERIISRLLGDSFTLCIFSGDDIRLSRKLKKNNL